MSADYTGDAARDAGMREVRERAVRWLAERGLLVRGESAGGRMRRLAAYREHIKTAAKPGPDQWARDLLARHKAGERILPQMVRMATDALGLSPEPVVVTPKRPVPRPDAKERQAGDVEVDTW